VSPPDTWLEVTPDSTEEFEELMRELIKAFGTLVAAVL